MIIMARKNLLLVIATLLMALLTAELSGQETEVIQESRVYKRIGGADLKADIFYTPKVLEGAAKPAIAFFHGGGWAYGTPSEFFGACERYARMGFITFSFQYRLSIREDGTVPHPDITPVECVKDARSALRWIRANAAGFNIDPDQIVAAGQSAGGQMALSTALIHSVNEESDNLEISPVPNAILLFSSNVNTMEAWADMLMGDRREEIWSISPHHNLEATLPPTLEFHGDSDCIVPLWIVQHFKSRADELGADFEMVVLEGKTHYLGEGNEKYATYFDEGILERADRFLREQGFLR
jgi:acetyl esterase